ncbi:LuxR C-terminal-related transcriptional regulator [Achromobacter sp. UMC46]|uniref:LuxR C-terminal-related transcriptional regulator n=1 Tax=Achromobacter sp. UMC46 TaxID=1862319 RepID=UPI0016036177|nr:LuxR C-terminal-related transcriptional regulator [Achromobacter sp. UMC46]
MAEHQIALRTSFDAAHPVADASPPWRGIPPKARSVADAEDATRRGGRLQRHPAVSIGWQSIDSAYSGFGEAVLLVGKGAIVEKMSALARRYLDDGHGWSTRNGRLRHADPKVQRLFDAYCVAVARDRKMRALATTASWGEVFWMDIGPAPDTLNPQGERMILVRMRRNSAFSMPDATRLRSVFSITHAEAAVLAGLAAGHSVEEVATLRQASVLTVRKQVASLLSKMECHRQSELVRLASLL